MSEDRKTIVGIDLASSKGDHSAVAMMRFDDGQEVRITALTISPPCDPIARLPSRGNFTVEGSVTAHFTSPHILSVFERIRRADENLWMRRIRPFLGRRAYRRLRGQRKAQRRAQR